MERSRPVERRRPPAAKQRGGRATRAGLAPGLAVGRGDPCGPPGELVRPERPALGLSHEAVRLQKVEQPLQQGLRTGTGAPRILPLLAGDRALEEGVGPPPGGRTTK
ncbi:hypothetical protein NDU88_005104 [Pleurodeles waltl]|uniref:Uncharacterized protein n=1 Tax=Pleurodeles waltl TaxID=8319 RepID=A0AAV7LN68_PLEWA|nr:hypothetical protein NDU88_005104 [Pleurodeles waltl]